MERAIIFKTEITYGELQAWATSKQISAIPVKNGDQYEVDVFLKGKYKKTSTQKYNSWDEAEANVLNTLYKNIGE